MNQINDLPTPRDFGQDFNYSVWTAGTQVTFCNVPWNSDYRDIVHFGNRVNLDAYIDNMSSPKIEITKMSYAKFGRPIRIDKPFNAVQRYNYIRANNPLQPIDGDIQKSFYYFILDVVYINPNCTEVYVQLDAWQTFGYNINFGNCYIERGHIGIANERGFDQFGREYLTEPEGLDIGGEYQVVDQWKRQLATTRNTGIETNPLDILVMSTVDLVADPGTIADPKLKSATGSSMENLPNGANLYLFSSLGQFRDFLEKRADQTWVLQGIISVTAIPSDAYAVPRTPILETVDGVGTIVGYTVDAGSLDVISTNLKSNWRDTMGTLLDRYAGLKKFLTYPYCLLEMTSYNGAPLVIKPESWNTADATVVEVPHFAPPGARLVFYPYRYNAAVSSTPDLDQSGVVNDGGEFLDFSTGIFNFPTFSIVNSGYISFMAANANSIAYQNSSADWSQQRALASNQLSYDQASSGINLSKDLVNQSMNAATQSTSLANQTAGFRAVQSGINSLGTMGKGNVIGAATGIANAGVGYAIDINQNNQSLGIANNLAAGQNRSSTENAAYLRDSNKSLADWSANGDYQNQIAGINAKIQDAKLTQPTTVGQVGGDAFNLAAYKWGYDVKVKLIDPAAMARQGEYWLRYGYAVNRFGTLPFNLQVMSKCTYWKLKETYITFGNCPETFKQAIRGILEKGVTVWNNPDEIGRIDFADNIPLAGITL